MKCRENAGCGGKIDALVSLDGPQALAASRPGLVRSLLSLLSRRRASLRSRRSCVRITPGALSNAVGISSALTHETQCRENAGLTDRRSCVDAQQVLAAYTAVRIAREVRR